MTRAFGFFYVITCHPSSNTPIDILLSIW
jgi:hypothetical protein